MSEKGVLNNIVKDIIMEQSHVIGIDLSVSRATNTGLIDVKTSDVGALKVSGEPTEVLSKLIHSYGEIFGQASVDVCVDILQDYPYNEIENFIPLEIKQRISK
jgi:hypothetical protein